MLSLSDRPTAVMCVNDHAACGLMRAAYTLGIRIPQELSVIGFDDDPLGQSSIFPLTTVRQPVSEMAKMAFYGVLDQLDNKEVLSKVLPTTLILRATTQHPMKECNS
jgi:LacI family transcriptional regulator